MTKDNGKVAIVTGGGSGIGKASAIALLNDGYSVVISGRREDPLTKTVEENGNSPRILGITCDVGDPESVKNLIPKFIKASGFIISAPEYNGSIPPILTNLIAWISVSTDQWREVFNGKKALIGTHSGGGGNNFIQSMKIQLGHLGAIVLPRTIVVNSYTKFDEESTKVKIKQLNDLL